jgi:hypothetical protein
VLDVVESVSFTPPPLYSLENSPRLARLHIGSHSGSGTLRSRVKISAPVGNRIVFPRSFIPKTCHCSGCKSWDPAGKDWIGGWVVPRAGLDGVERSSWRWSASTSGIHHARPILYFTTRRKYLIKSRRLIRDRCGLWTLSLKSTFWFMTKIPLTKEVCFQALTSRSVRNCTSSTNVFPLVLFECKEFLKVWCWYCSPWRHSPPSGIHRLGTASEIAFQEFTWPQVMLSKQGARSYASSILKNSIHAQYLHQLRKCNV